MSFMKECSDPNLGFYDMRIDTTGMPKSLATKLNSHICNKGGGGSTSTSGIDPEFKPNVKRALDIATNRLEGQFDEAGNLIDPSAAGIVAGFSPTQSEGMGAQTKLARDAISGTGIYDDKASAQRMLENLSGTQTAGALSGLGSSRMQKSMQSNLLDKAFDIQQMRQQKAEGGAASLRDVGTTEQEQKQRILDAPYTELQRYSNLLMGIAPKETKTSGGGK